MRKYLLGVCLSISLVIFYSYHINHNEVKFLLTSEGATASNWLTSILNSIPEIKCSHYNIISNRNNSIATIDMQAVSLDEYFNLLKYYTNKKRKIYGNVHGLIINTALQKPGYESIRIANLLRHPINHLDSMHKFWLRANHKHDEILEFIAAKNLGITEFPASNDQYTCNYNEALHYFNKLQKLGYVIDDTIENWTFLILLGRYHRVHSDILKAQSLNIPQYKFEDYTTNKQVLGDMIRYITNDKIKLSAEELTLLLNTPASNINSISKHSAQEIYGQWTNWQQAAFAMHLLEVGDSTNNAYTNHGYDLSFVAL